jgi:hypothetical protein
VNQLPGFFFEAKQVSASTAGLIHGSIDFGSRELAEQKCANSSVGYDGDVASWLIIFDKLIHRVRNADLCVDGPFPAFDGLIRIVKKPGGHGLKCFLGKETGAGSIVFSQ